MSKKRLFKTSDEIAEEMIPVESEEDEEEDEEFEDEEDQPEERVVRRVVRRVPARKRKKGILERITLKDVVLGVAGIGLGVVGFFIGKNSGSGSQTLSGDPYEDRPRLITNEPIDE